MMHLVIRALGKIVARPIRRKLYAFLDATHHPERVQADLLRGILARQAGTGFGRDHGFAGISSVADFRKRVPIGPYEYHAPYIERMRQGDTNALVSDRVLMFALTSGTTAARKLIPVTPSYLDAYRRGWNIWGLKAYRDHRPVIFRPIVQLVGNAEEFRTESGIPCGNLSGLTANVQKRIVKFLYLVPPTTGGIKDATTRYYVALRMAIRKQIGMLIAPNPSTLVALGRTLETHAESFVRDMHDGTLSPTGLDVPDAVRAAVRRKLKPMPERARLMEDAIRRDGALRPSAVWEPGRTLIGTWTGGSVGAYVKLLPKFYGDAAVRDLGLLASEGRMTLPFDDNSPSGVLDITSHYFEFVPEGEIDSPRPTVLGAHELREGGTYYILPTTAAGLYRYHIVDLVRCTGFLNNTPLIEFLGKGNRFSSLTGEKLSEHQVVQAAREAGVPAAYTLAPVWDERRPYYALFVEEPDAPDAGRLSALLADLDAALKRHNDEYAAKRDSDRLGPVRAALLPAGTWATWDRERLSKTGGSPEQYKRPCLIGDVGFRATMPVIREAV